MRRTVALTGLWLLAGAVAVGAASAGVGVVSRELTGRTHPAPMSAEQVAVEVAAATSSTTTPDSTTTSVAAATSTTATTAGGTATPTTTPTTTSPAPITRSYQLIGGSATLRFSPSGVTVLVATPEPGFTAEVEPEGSGIKVEFESEGHRSRVDAWWDGGPQASVREDADH